MNSLMYSMGYEEDDILQSFDTSAEGRKTYSIHSFLYEHIFKNASLKIYENLRTN